MHDDVDATEALDRGGDEPLEIVRVRDVARDGDATEALRLALEDVLAAGEHDNVRAGLGERFCAAEPDP